MLEGDMEYQTNNQSIHLYKGEGIFVNSNNLHSGWLCENSECNYIAVIFNPILIFGYQNSSVEKKYITPIIDSQAFSSFFLNPENKDQNEIIQHLLEIHNLYEKKSCCFELKINSRLCAIWELLYQHFQKLTEKDKFFSSRDIPRLKQAMDFIQKNFKEKLTLNDISASCNVSKSECCRLFKNTLRQTPFDYLLCLRIEKSIPLLLENKLNITEISEMVGFSGSSYFSEIFKRYLYCSPSEYRKTHCI